jgi:radical SAM superfamily enzyme YgiQ (UPF0313 family)
MKLRILLINPWIYDFAAYNLWARPLGLLKVAEYLSSFDVSLSLIDCMEDSEVTKYGAGHYRFDEVAKPEILKEVRRKFKRYGMPPGIFRERLRKSGPIDLVVMTSMMAYWYPGIQEAIAIIKEELGDIPLILGGIYATLYHKHASDHSGADFIYRGQVNSALKFAISTFGFRMKKKCEERPYYEMLPLPNRHCTPLLTSTGCPFQCSYCASSILADFSQRSPEEVLREVLDFHEKGVTDFAFYDDALLINSVTHLKPLLRAVIAEGLRVRFHTPNGLHARFIDQELAGLMKQSGFTTIRLSLETINDERQTKSGGKVLSEDVERAVSVIWKAGFTKKDVGVYIMYGLPGQELNEVMESIAFLKELGSRINLTELAPIKGTQSWDELKRSGVITEDLDPLLTNNSIFPLLFSGYNAEEVEKMKLDVKAYNRS